MEVFKERLKTLGFKSRGSTFTLRKGDVLYNVLLLKDRGGDYNIKLGVVFVDYEDPENRRITEAELHLSFGLKSLYLYEGLKNEKIKEIIRKKEYELHFQFIKFDEFSLLQFLVDIAFPFLNAVSDKKYLKNNFPKNLPYLPSSEEETDYEDFILIRVNGYNRFKEYLNDNR